MTADGPSCCRRGDGSGRYVNPGPNRRASSLHEIDPSMLTGNFEALAAHDADHG